VADDLLGLMGLFKIALKYKRPRARHIADSSYWLYLIHLPLIISGQVLLLDVNLAAIIEFTIIVAIAIVVLLLSYQFLVRYTWIRRL
jgi:glucan biosynthesis protein C